MRAQRLLTRDSKTKLPFLTYGEDGTIMNGHWDVTETKEFLEGIRRGKRCLNYLVYRPIPKAILALRDLMCIGKLRDAALLYKTLKVMKEGIYIGAEYYNPMFCFG
jgi:hypothetical protein